MLFSSVPWLVDNLADFQSIIVKIRGSVFEQHRVTRQGKTRHAKKCRVPMACADAAVNQYTAYIN